MILVEHLTKKLDRRTILDDITLSMECGKYGLLGPNGAGKTTFMRCLLNIYKVPEGCVSLGETSVKVGYLPQGFEGFSQMSVMDTMKYFSSMKGIKKKNWNDEINRCLNLVDMNENQKKKCGKLSGGMLRRVGIAQAMIGNPEILFMDEPTAGLDPEERARFVAMIHNLPETTMVLFSTHMIEDVESCCDHVIIMDQGKLCYHGSCERLITQAQQCISEGTYQGTRTKATLQDGYMCVRKGLVTDEG